MLIHPARWQARGSLLDQLSTELPKVLDAVRRAHAAAALLVLVAPSDHLLSEPEPEPVATPAAAQVVPSSPMLTAQGEHTVASWLQDTKLAMCEEALAEAGYDAELDMIIEGDAEEVADMLEAVEAIGGIKKPTVKKFKRELAKIRGQAETFE